MSTWTINKTAGAHRGHFTIKRNGHEVGTLSLLDDLYYPETVLAAICEVLATDETCGAF